MDFDDVTLALVDQVARLRLNEANNSRNFANVGVHIESLSASLIRVGGAKSLSDFCVTPFATPPICIADNWITCHFDEKTSTPETIDAFTALWRPSCTTLSDAEWIAVNRGMIQNPDPPRIEEMKAHFQVLAQSHRQDGNITLTVSALDQLAHQFNVTSGKWLVFTDLQTVDASWTEIVKLVCIHRRKGFAKVSVNKNANHHVICVYVDDFSDVAEVKKLREDLRKIGVTKKIGFKLDAYSHLGIYARNVWGISPNRYFE